MESLKKQLSEISAPPPEVFNFLNGILGKHFQGKNKEILHEMLKRLSFDNPEDLFQKIMYAIRKQTGEEVINLSDIEKLDVLAIGKELFSGIEMKGASVELTSEEAENFEITLKKFSRSTLHDVAFPILVVENPQVAASVKNLICRTFDSIKEQENLDVSDVYEELDIENLPTEFSLEMLIQLGGSIPGLEMFIPPPVINEISENESSEIAVNESVEKVEQAHVIYERANFRSVPLILYCELTDEQALYLSYCLKQIDAITNIKKFHSLLKSKGKYEDVYIKDKAIVLSIIYLLHKKHTISGIRYLSTNGNGFWSFFQQHLIDWNARKPFDQKLSKLREAYFKEEEAMVILDDVLLPKNQAKNLDIIKKEILKK